MIKRNEYMQGTASFDQYYGQFITPSIRDLLSRHLGKRLREILYLNEIELDVWDSIAHIMPVNRDVFKEVAETDSLATRVCILKTAAKQLINDWNNETYL